MICHTYNQGKELGRKVGVVGSPALMAMVPRSGGPPLLKAIL